MVNFMKAQKRHPLIVGTAILTITGFISRIIGFFYRIYLSRLFGEEGMGIYQLLNPVLALSFSLTAAGYQTSISKFVAEKAAKEKKDSYQPMFVGLSISLPLSLICCFLIYSLADFIGTQLLMEKRTVPMLRILAFSIPLGSVHSCINGYFYGTKKTGIPAATQLLEQLTRVSCVYGISAYTLSKGTAPTINIAVIGLAIGEFVSMLLSIISIYVSYVKSHKNISFPPSKTTQCVTALSARLHKATPIYGSILGMALPLTANRIVLNLLQGIESISIPAQLKLYGYDTTTALSVYGVLTGMAMPLIFFPNALTGSVAVLLLPMISESYALGDMNTVKRNTQRTVKYCLCLGLLCMSIFLLGGKWAGHTLFHSALAGHFITTLGFICPFIYLDTTLSSILQGLGMASQIFLMNVVCLLLRLLFIFLTMPHLGITGYLWGLLAGQLLQSILYLLCLYRFCQKH